VNFFQPSFKIIEKSREGARVRKRYASPKTPCARLLECDEISEGMKERLREIARELDPLKLLDEIRGAQQQLVDIADGVSNHVAYVDRSNADLGRFLSGLATAWQDGEIRPTHRRKPRTRRYWRTREDPFAEVWTEVSTWLESEPDRTAKELFERLQAKYPSTFQPGQLRTLQRRVKEWRTAQARKLVFVMPLNDDVRTATRNTPSGDNPADAPPSEAQDATTDVETSVASGSLRLHIPESDESSPELPMRSGYDSPRKAG